MSFANETIPMPMSNAKLKFTRLRLRNWKNFPAADVSVQDRMFLVGPNASGKSNLLDAFRFLRDLASPGGGLQEAVRRRGGVKAIRCLAARRKSDVEIHVDLQETNNSVRWEYALAIHPDNQGRPRVRKVCEKFVERIVLGIPLVAQPERHRMPVFVEKPLPKPEKRDRRKIGQ